MSTKAHQLFTRRDVPGSRVPEAAPEAAADSKPLAEQIIAQNRIALAKARDARRTSTDSKDSDADPVR